MKVAANGTVVGLAADTGRPPGSALPLFSRRRVFAWERPFADTPAVILGLILLLLPAILTSLV